MKILTKTTLVILRLMTKATVQKYYPKINLHNKKGSIILCTDILSGSTWIECTNVMSIYPARYKKVITVNSSTFYAYTKVYIFKVTKNITITLPDGSKQKSEAGNHLLRFMSGALFLIQDGGKKFPLWIDTRNKNKSIITD